MRARRYAYLNARVSVLAARLFPPAVPDAQTDDRAYITQALKTAGLQGDRDDAPRFMERRMFERLVAEATILLRALGGPQRAMLRHWMRRFELLNLKILIRARWSSDGEEDLSDQLLDMGALTDLPLQALLRSEDLAELLRRLEHTPYANMARQAQRGFAEHHDLFSVEAGLERQYFDGLIQRLAALPRGDRAPLREFLTVFLDQINLVWLLRYRFAYGLEAPQTFFLLTPLGSSFTSALAQLVQANDLAEAISRLPDTLRQRLDGVHGIAEVELRMEQRTAAKAEHLLRVARFELVRAFAYLYLRETQFRRLYMLVKARALQLGPELVHEAGGRTASAGAR